MAGAVINPPQVTGTVNMSTGQTSSASHKNSIRISTVIDRLFAHVRGCSKNDSNVNVFFNLCLSLSRGIDFAVANNEIPVNASELPCLLKQVYQWSIDTPLQAAIMVLLISIKSACRNGWFSEKDNEDLQGLLNEISSNYCSDKDMNSGEKNTIHHSIPAVMSRFYPSMKMGKILAVFEAMPGYGAFVKDFYITEKSSDEKIYLFVAQIDGTETSSCIISPQQVNFLLNGRAVDGRNCVYKDPGPQIPTLVKHMLKRGTNLLQVVGQFNEKYIIVVAYMNMVSIPSCPTLPNYVPTIAAAPDSDNEIIEGPSRISLNCPISFKRIKTPVKGQLCKHRQCFDFDNYVDINSRRPSWRCPHCSQSVCFTDIRIDQSMVKVLKEVGVNISHVKISADGSWEAVNEGNDHTDKPQDTPPLNQEPTTITIDADIVDLTQLDNHIYVTNSHQNIDKKPSLVQLQNQPNPNNQIPIHNPHMNITPQMENAFQIIHSNTPPNGPIMQGQSQTPVSNNTPLNVAILQGQSQTPVSNIKYGNGGYLTHGKRVMRIPVAVQALAAQNFAGDRQHSQQQLTGFHMNSHQIMRMLSQPQELCGGSGPPQQPSNYQYTSLHHQMDQFNPHQHQSVRSPAQMSPQGAVGLGPTNGLGNNPHPHHYTMAAAAQQTIQVSSWTPSVSSPFQTSAQQTVPSVPASFQTYAQQTVPSVPASFQTYAQTVPSVPASFQTSASSMPMASSVTNGGPKILEEQNWRPSGRMRGSLSGQAYEDALNQYMFYPTQPVQAVRPPVFNTPRPVILPPHLQVLIANNRNMIGSQGRQTLFFDTTNGGGGSGSGGGFR